MNKEQYEELKSKPEFDVLRRILLQTVNGNMMRLHHTSYYAEETRQIFQKLDSMGYQIVRKQND